MKKILLIQGVFFQAMHAFSIGYKPGEGAAAMVGDSLRFGIFYGVAGPQSDSDTPQDGTYSGRMHDYVGYSAITNLKVTDTEVSFTKQYDHRKPIAYTFTKKDPFGVWVGGYNGHDCGTGLAKCLITEVDENFLALEEEKIQEMLDELRNK